MVKSRLELSVPEFWLFGEAQARGNKVKREISKKSKTFLYTIWGILADFEKEIKIDCKPGNSKLDNHNLSPKQSQGKQLL